MQTALIKLALCWGLFQGRMSPLGTFDAPKYTPAVK